MSLDWALTLLWMSLAAAAAPARQNVLFIVIDDLRPDIGAFSQSFMQTPNIDALARESLVLERAYTNYPYCSPSRNSFMSGRSPDTTLVYNFLDHFREASVGANWTALPEYFKQHGYWTMGSGKLYHPMLPPHDDNPRSWTKNLTDFGGNGGCVCEDLPSAEQPFAPMMCALPDAPGPKDAGGCPDVHIVNTVIDQLHVWNSSVRSSNVPFFVGLGIHKPHLPWAAPKRFFDQYDEDQLAVAAHPFLSDGMPAVAYHHCQWQPMNDTCALTEGAGNSTCLHPREGPVSDALARRARHGYYAAVSFMDSLVGRALDALASLGEAVERSTAVILTSDHGWQLGEHNEWCKTTLFDLALHIPMLIKAPFHPGYKPGARTRGFAENLDIYRTLAELAGLPPPLGEGESGVEGTSLVGLIRDPSAGKDAAFSQQARCLKDPSTNATIDLWTAADSCTSTPRESLSYMGYSVRVECWRMTYWLQWEGSPEKLNWDKPFAVELYAHCGGDERENLFDRYENVNLAGDLKFEPIRDELKQRLRARFMKSPR